MEKYEEELREYVENYTNLNFEYGKFLSSPPPGEEIVISGISGSFPDSRNVKEFSENLYNKVNLVTCDDRVWKLDNPEIPKLSGRLFDLDAFDAGYFGIHYRQAHRMDPGARVLLERTVEAIMDAGINPKDLAGTRTAVFVGTCFSETEKTWYYDSLTPQGYAITGVARAMMARRISYFLKLENMSYACDVACSSSLYAMENAYRAIRSGKCDKAIVLGSNLCRLPTMTHQFVRLGVLSTDGACRSFDADGSGYVRSEACVALLLEKAKDAKRSYGTVIHGKTNCDGYKPQSLTFPSSVAQQQLLAECYIECGIDPTQLSYLEAHVTGTRVGDPEEMEAVYNIYCKRRETPLLVGSVKSCIGHAEPASGLCSVAKVIIAMHNELIPPNQNFTRPREGLKGFEENLLKVVTESTPFEDDRGLIGINSFGFGGSNCHVLVRWNEKLKNHNLDSIDDLPRLVCVSGRVEDSVKNMLDDLKKRPLDVEYIRLYHNLFKDNHDLHFYRGFGVYSKTGEIKRSYRKLLEKKTLYLVFSDFGKSWYDITRQLYSIPLFAKKIEKIYDILKPKINLSKPNGILSQIMGSISLQLALCDLLNDLNLCPDYYFGYGIYDLVCAYFDEAIGLEEALWSAYHIAKILTGKNEKIDEKDSHLIIKGQLAKVLQEIIKVPKKRSGRWLSANPTNLASADYFVTTIQLQFSPQHFNLNKNCILFEFGTTGLNLNINKQEKSILFFNSSDSVLCLLEILGSLFEVGFSMDIHKLYPEVEFPVSRSTPMIAPLVRWDRSNSYFAIAYDRQEDASLKPIRNYDIDLNRKVRFLEGHVINGLILCPAAYYLYIVLDFYQDYCSPADTYIFENCRFLRAITLSKHKLTSLTVALVRSTGDFIISENNIPIVTGRIYNKSAEESDETSVPPPPVEDTESDNTRKLTTKDIYKELKLRGYGYRGSFRRLHECNQEVTKASVIWDDDIVSYLDNLFQIKILQLDSRLLYVPTTIKHLSINTHLQKKYVETFADEHPAIPIYYYKECDLIKSGHVEIRGLLANSIPKRRDLAEPVLEKYQFIPNYLKETSIEISSRIIAQTIIENFHTLQMKIYELVDEATNLGAPLVSPHLRNALADLPLISPDIKILSKEPIEDTQSIPVENQKLNVQDGAMLVIGSKLLERPAIIKQASKATLKNGFIITREDINSEISVSDFDIFTIHETTWDKIILLRKHTEIDDPVNVINVDDIQTFSWIEPLKDAIKKSKNCILVSEKNPTSSGILGFVNCLRREPNLSHAKAVFIMDPKAPPFDPKHPLYKEQLSKNIAINIYKDSKWGTYRHLLLENLAEIQSRNAYVNTAVRGDLSSFKWFAGSTEVTKIDENDKSIVHVYYAALNFRDVMLAINKIGPDVITLDRRFQNALLGFEFVGRTSDGRRVFGMSDMALASVVQVKGSKMWEIPDHLSFEEAATIPCVYLTVLYALFYIGKIKKGETILIHAGSGGIGQAAINVALRHGLKVYTTVGTNEKREYIKKKFPEITDAQIGNSRDISFEQMIYSETNGRGVDIVLNSLADEKLVASIRCLARHGRFLEIGKFDLAANSKLYLLFLEKEASFHGIMLDFMFKDEYRQNILVDIFTKAIKNNYLVPLDRTVFEKDQIEEAFRFMAHGKHMGKVIVKIRDEESERICKPSLIPFKCLPVHYCHPEKVNIIIGGLGGFGLELTDWLILRGAQKLILVSRKGVTNGYQLYRMRFWKNMGVNIHISTDDTTTTEGCEELLRKANELGEVEGIYNLAVQLKDQLFENQTPDDFKISLNPKAVATQILDETSRKLCPNLKKFVVFSSVSCGRGNAGQTNYGMANSIMERICEKRVNEGYPALAIQWGAVGDVGLVAEMQKTDSEIEIGGTLQQKISNCLNTLDTLLNQDHPVVSSMVVAEKKICGATTIVGTVCALLGVRDLKSINPNLTLPELGMDSMSGVEIKQTLERDFNVFLSAQDMRTLTFAKLLEIQEDIDKGEIKVEKDSDAALHGFELMVQLLGDEENYGHDIFEIRSNIESQDESTPIIWCFPGIDGSYKIFEALAENLKGRIMCLQYPTMTELKEITIEDISNHVISVIEKIMKKDKPFYFLGYSWGVTIALEAASYFENNGYNGTIFCVDGAPFLMRHLLKSHLDIGSELQFQITFLIHLLGYQYPNDLLAKFKDKLTFCSSFEERMAYLGQELLQNNFTGYPVEFWKRFAVSSYARLKSIKKYYVSYSKIKSDITLYKPTNSSITNVPDDYSLSELAEQSVEVKIFSGNHVTVLRNADLADDINNKIYGTTKIEGNEVSPAPA